MLGRHAPALTAMWDAHGHVLPCRRAKYDRTGELLHLTPIEKCIELHVFLSATRAASAPIPEFMSLFSFTPSATGRPTLEPAMSSQYSRLSMTAGSTGEADNLPLDLNHRVH
jgi:hypothetical protein